MEKASSFVVATIQYCIFHFWALSVMEFLFRWPVNLIGCHNEDFLRPRTVLAIFLSNIFSVMDGHST